MNRADPERARSEARFIIAEFSVKVPSVPIERIVKGKGIVLQYAPLEDELSGFAYIKKNVRIIGVNALHHPNRQRFSIAHELGHHILHEAEITGTVHVDKSFRVLHRDALASQGVDPLEIDANAFASELLMPEEFLRREIGDVGLDIDDEQGIEALARKFKVSASAMRIRLARNFG